MQYQYLILNKLEHQDQLEFLWLLFQLQLHMMIQIFLLLNKYFSQSLIIDLSGQKNGFLEIILSFHFLISHPNIPNWVTAPITLNFLPNFF